MKDFNGTILCEYCEKFRDLDQWASENKLEHHNNIAALCNSAQAGCHLCEAFIRHGLFSTKLENRIVLPPRAVEDIATAQISLEDSGQLMGRSSQIHLYLIQRASGQQRARYISILEKYTTYDDPLAPMILGRPIAAKSGSEECLKVIFEWYRKCKTEHYVCEPNYETPLPTRVIDVGSDNQQPFLLVSAGRKAQYATLSHCWGGMSPTTTTLATLEARRKAIQLGDLPGTFADAIMLTRKLGLQYLWIDSLCIIQDSHNDWLTESGMMGEVYRKCSVNIAAASAFHAGQGLFHGGDRERHRAKPLISIPCFSTRLQAQGTIFLRQLTRNDLLEQPLHRRGWVLQESMLSPIRVDFASSQLHWNCRNYCLSEAFPTEAANQISNPLMAGAKELYHMPMAKYKPTPDLIDFETISPMRWWYTALNSFIQRGITNHEDLLPAIAGVASIVAQVSSYHYGAGIWSEDILRGLLWQSSAPLTKPSTLIVPSWSWASTNLPWVDKPRFGLELDYYLSGHRAVVSRFVVDTVSNYPFGQVLSSELQLETRCRPLSDFHHLSTEDHGLLTFWHEANSHPDDETCKPIKCTLDCLPPDAVSCKTDLLARGVICAQIASFGEFRPDAFYQGESVGSVFALLLEPTRGEGWYKRIGLLQLPICPNVNKEEGWELKVLNIA